MPSLRWSLCALCVSVFLSCVLRVLRALRVPLWMLFDGKEAGAPAAKNLFQEGSNRGAEVGVGACQGVHPGTESDTLRERNAVQLIELSLGEGESIGAGLRQSGEHGVHRLLELAIGNRARDEPGGLRLGRGQHPAGDRKIER